MGRGLRYLTTPCIGVTRAFESIFESSFYAVHGTCRLLLSVAPSRGKYKDYHTWLARYGSMVLGCTSKDASPIASVPSTGVMYVFGRLGAGCLPAC